MSQQRLTDVTGPHSNREFESRLFFGASISCRWTARGLLFLALAPWASSLGRAQLTVAATRIPESHLIALGDTVDLDKFEVHDERLSSEAYRTARTTTATKTDTPLLDVPQSVTVISRDLINDQAMQGIGDVTRYVPGVSIAQGEGNRDTPVLRGNSTTADFFTDGLRDDVQYIRDLYNVERVEILKGPNAMIFGRGGSGGVINRVTKQAVFAPVRELTLQVGSWDQKRATLDVAQPANHQIAVRFTAMYEDSDTYRDGVSLERYGINPTVAWAISPSTSARVSYEHFHDRRTADRGIPSYLGRPIATDASTFFGDPDQSDVQVTVDSVGVFIDHDFGNGLTLRNATRYAYYDKFYQNIFPGVVNAAGTSVSISAYNNGTQRENVFNQTDLVFRTETGAIKHELLAGLELARQETDNLRLTGYFPTAGSGSLATSVTAPVSNPRISLPLVFQPGATDANNHGVAKNVAVYGQDQITLLPQLLAIVGARFERFTVDFRNNRTAQDITSKDHLVSPRAGLVYKPRPEISLYTSYSISNLPRAGEQLSSLSLTNRSLDPEKFENYEIGAKWDLRPSLSFSAAVYQLDRSNVVVPDPNDATKSILVDGQQAKGVELGASGKLTKHWSAIGGYAYQDGEIKRTQSATAQAGARLANLPRHTFSFWNRYDLNATWGFGLGLINRSAVFASTDNTVTVPGFTRIDAAVFVRLTKNLRAQANVENVLDRSYYASVNSNNNITPGSPRALRVSLTATF